MPNHGPANRPTPRALPAEAVRELDRRAIEDFGVPGVVLMENAGRGAAALALEMLAGSAGPVLILAGRGNNGGDGYVLARHLANLGVLTRTLVLAPFDKISGDTLINLNIIRRLGLPVASVNLDTDEPLLAEALASAVLVVDALLGTGIRGEVHGPLRHAIELVNASGKPVLALDIPSGLDADSGALLGVAVKASVTATFLCPKLGLTRGAGPALAGRVVVVDIGVPVSLPSRPAEGSAP